MSFNPQDHLMPMKGGKKYLPVAARLMWLNDSAADFCIETEFLDLNEKYAIARAKVTVTSDAGTRSAMGTKREDKSDFADFESKAETGAVGRALGMLGFGTQFAPEFDESDTRGSEPRVVDAPQEPKAKPAPKAAPVQPASEAPAEGDSPPEYDHSGVSDDDLFSEAKVRRLMSIGGKLFNLKGDALEDRLCHAASKILGQNVADLHALYWKHGNDVMKKLEEEAVKRGVWEASKS